MSQQNLLRIQREICDTYQRIADSKRRKVELGKQRSTGVVSSEEWEKEASLEEEALSAQIDFLKAQRKLIEMGGTA